MKDILDSGSDRGNLQDDLHHCRRELAQVREQQEEWMEQAALLPKAVASRDRFATALAKLLSTAYWGRQRPGQFLPGGMRGRLARWVLEFGRRPDPDWQLIELIEQSPYFDPVWYLSEYPDVVGANQSPAEHYLHHGAAEGRDPGPDFSTYYYLQNAPEIAETSANPLVHFIRHGKAEGKLPSGTAS